MPKRLLPLLLSFFLLTIPLSLFAQSLSGSIIDEDSQALPGVQVYIPLLERGTVSDPDGKYLIENLPEGAIHIEFRFIGYVTQKETVILQGDDSHKLDIILRETTLHAHEVVVERDRIDIRSATMSVSVVDGRELDLTRGQSLASIIKDQAGVTVISTGPSIQKPVIRGLHSQRVTVVNSGVSQEGQQWGGEHAPEIDPFSPSSIEIIRGAAGVEYGIGAIGGVIKVSPAELSEETRISGGLSTNLFENNRQVAGSFHLGSAMSFLPGAAWRIQASGRKAGASTSPLDFISNSGFVELNSSLGLGYHGDEIGVDIHASHFGTSLGLFTDAHFGNAADLERAIERGRPSSVGEFTYDIESPKQTIAHDMLTVDAHYDWSQNSHLQLIYGLQNNGREEFDAHGQGNSEKAAFRLDLLTNSLELKNESLGENYIRSLGLSYTNQANRNGESGQLIPNYRSHALGAFLRESRILDSWTIEGGGRFDYKQLGAWLDLGGGSKFEKNDKSWSSITGIVGVIKSFGQSYSLSSTLSSAWRPPSVNELYNFGVHHGTAQFEEGNPDLKLERSLSLDISARVDTELIHGELSLYANRIRDFIHVFPTGQYRVTIRGSYPNFEYQQTDALLKGFDARVEFHPFPLMSLGLSTSMIIAEDTSAELPLINMPSDRLGGSFGYDLPWFHRLYKTNLELSFSTVFRQDRFPEGVDFSDPPDGYTLVNLEFSSDFPWLTKVGQMSVSVRNIFDTKYRDYLSRYRYFVDDPGRDVVLRINVPFG